MNKLKKVIDQTGFEDVFLYDSSKRLAFSKDRNENEYGVIVTKDERIIKCKKL